MNELAKQTASPKKLVEMWNKRFPIGTHVRYWIDSKRTGMGKKSSTKGEAFVHGDHMPMVMIEGQLGAVALSDIEPFA